MIQYVFMLHSAGEKGKPLYVMADAIDYFERDPRGATWIYFRGGNAVKVAESPKEIFKILGIYAGNISLTDTRSEQERWLNGE